MPYSYKDGNIPESMKYLKPSIQKKGISIANAILRNGGSEGVAISTGIKKAKELHKKKIEKTAFIQAGPHSNLPNAFENADLGARTDIPLAKGLPKRKGIVKLAALGFKIKRINLDHLKDYIKKLKTAMGHDNEFNKISNK